MKLNKEEKKVLTALAFVSYQYGISNNCGLDIIKLMDKINELDLKKIFKTLTKYLTLNKEITYNDVFKKG